MMSDSHLEMFNFLFFFFSSRRRHTRYWRDWSSDVCSSDLGIDEAENELVEIVDFLKDPKKYTRLGGAAPKGVLLVGAPGTGKTLLARAVAGEAGGALFSLRAPEFVELFVGVGARGVREIGRASCRGREG